MIDKRFPFHVRYELREDGRYRIEETINRPFGEVVSVKEEKVNSMKHFWETMAWILRK